MGRVSKRDTKMLNQLVRDCVFYGLNERESLIYINKRSGGLIISRSNFYNIKKRISENEEELAEERLAEHVRIGYVINHFSLIDAVERIQIMLFQLIKAESMRPVDKRNLFSISRISKNIFDNVSLLRHLNIDTPFVKVMKSKLDAARLTAGLSPAERNFDDEPVVE